MVTAKAGVDIAVRFIQWVGRNFPGHEWPRKATELVSPLLIFKLDRNAWPGWNKMQNYFVIHAAESMMHVVLSRELGSWKVPTVRCKVGTVSS